MPDLFFVSIVVIGLFYLGLAVKIVAYIIIRLKGRNEENLEEDTEQFNNDYITEDTDNAGNDGNSKEEDIPSYKQKEDKDKEKRSKKGNKNTDEDKEAREKKDKLIKRMKSIKEAEKNETMAGSNEAPEGNSVKVTDKDKTEDKESSTLLKEDIKNSKLPGTETKPGAKTERTRPVNYSNNKPKRFVVTNEHSAAKRDKGSSLPENKRDRSSNRGNSKNSPDNRRKINRNNNSANNSRGTREGGINRKSDSVNKRKSNYNNTASRNNTVKDSRNSKK